MTPEFDDVLLTAYLDDEVTDAEREKVEEQLRTSAASRKLLEELRSVRNLVTQLHRTQSTRSYQQGPWNQANLATPEESFSASEMPKRVSHDPRSHWKLPFQRLASLAALIAIVVCGRILLLQPNTPAISRSNDTSSESDVALSVSQGADRVRFGNAPLPPSPKFQVPIGPVDEKSKSQFSENRPAVSSRQSESFFLDDLLKDQSQEWKVRDVQEVESLDRKSYDWVDHFVLQENANSPKPDEPIKKLYFRYRSAIHLGRVAGESTAPLEESATTKEQEPVELDKQAVEKQKKVAERPLMVEFEIPCKNWASGAKRLRQMGISVPLELPDAEYLEFTGVPIEASARAGAADSGIVPSDNRSERGSSVSGSLDLSRWTVQPAEPLEGQRSLGRLGEMGATLSKSGASVMERPSSIRIRVRVLSTAEK